MNFSEIAADMADVAFEQLGDAAIFTARVDGVDQAPVQTRVQLIEATDRVSSDSELAGELYATVDWRPIALLPRALAGVHRSGRLVMLPGEPGERTFELDVVYLPLSDADLIAYYVNEITA